MNAYKPKSYWESIIIKDKTEIDLIQSVITLSRLDLLKASKLREAKLRLEVFYHEANLYKLKELLQSKLEAYKMYLVGYEKELALCESDFDSTLAIARKNPSDGVYLALSNYDKLKEEDKNHLEVKNILFKNLTSLLLKEEKK